MKNLIVLTCMLSTILAYGQANETRRENDWTKMKLKGEVHILEEQFSSGQKTDDFTTIYIFNVKGYIEKIIDPSSETIIKYDTTGNRIEEKKYDKTGTQSLLQSTTFKDNLPLYIQGFNNKGEETGKAEFLYVNNKVSKEIEYDNHQIHSYFEYKYDDKGNKVEIKKFNSKDELKLRNTYKYDQNNNQVEFSIYDWKTNEIIETYKSIYNAKNEVTVVLTYDANDKLIDKKEYTYQYKFDSKGNWTYSVKSIDKMNYNTTISRKIEYY